MVHKYERLHQGWEEITYYLRISHESFDHNNDNVAPMKIIGDKERNDKEGSLDEASNY